METFVKMVLLKFLLLPKKIWVAQNLGWKGGWEPPAPPARTFMGAITCFFSQTHNFNNRINKLALTKTHARYSKACFIHDYLRQNRMYFMKRSFVTPQFTTQICQAKQKPNPSLIISFKDRVEHCWKKFSFRNISTTVWDHPLFWAVSPKTKLNSQRDYAVLLRRTRKYQ